MHKLLQRQLARFVGSPAKPPEQWRAFLQAASEAYEQADAQRRILERSLQLSSQELLEANSAMRSIFQLMPDHFFLLDAEGTILSYHGGAPSDLLGPPERFLGWRIQEVCPPQLGKQFLDATAHVRRTRALVCFECAWAGPRGQLDVEVRLVPWVEERVGAIVREITERKQTQDALEAKVKELETLNRLMMEREERLLELQEE